MSHRSDIPLKQLMKSTRWVETCGDCATERISSRSGGGSCGPSTARRSRIFFTRKYAAKQGKLIHSSERRLLCGGKLLAALKFGSVFVMPHGHSSLGYYVTGFPSPTASLCAQYLLSDCEIRTQAERENVPRSPDPRSLCLCPPSPVTLVLQRGFRSGCLFDDIKPVKLRTDDRSTG